MDGLDSIPYMSVKQVAAYLQLNEKKIYELANEGSIPATKVTGKWMFPRELINRWMLYSSHDGLLSDRLVIAGSDDPLLVRMISSYSAESGARVLISYSPTAAKDGLNLLEARRVDVSCIHWGPFDESHTRHPALLQQYPQHRNWVLIRAFKREVGLVLAPGIINYRNDPSIYFEAEFRWVKRQAGTGSQRFMQEMLVKYGKTTKSLNGDGDKQALSERESAAAIAMGLADIAPGVRAAATEFGLGFYSMGWEAFDFAIPRNIWFRHLFQDLISELKSPRIKQTADELSGYDLESTGELVWGVD